MSGEARDVTSLEAPPVAPGHLSRHLLARHLAGELTGAAGAEIAAHLAGCPQCQARLDDLDAQRRAFQVRHPTAAFLAALEARAPRRPRWRWPAALGLVAAAATAAAVVLMMRADPGAPRLEPPTTRLKAGIGLSFHVRSGDAVRLGESGGVYHPGDAIQLRYTSPEPAHLIVISLDAAGAVTAFYEDAGQTLAVAPGAGRLLPNSVVLDDALGPERVIGCFADAPLRTDEVVSAGARALAAARGDPRAVSRLDLPCAQTSFLIEKRRRDPP